jgi:hypothetical protein
VEKAGLYARIFWYLNVEHPVFSFPAWILKKYEKTGIRDVLIGKLLSLMSNKAPKDKKYVFIGTKYKSLIRALPRAEVLVIGAVKQGLYSLLFRIPFVSDVGFYRKITMAYKQNDALILQCIINEMANLLKFYSATHVVVSNDSLPLERLWIEAAMSLGVETVCMQHGLFAPSNSVVNDGKFSNIMFVFDEHQKNIVELSSDSKVYVLGYHSNLETYPINNSSKEIVCIFGQPWAVYYRNREELYIRYLEDIMSMLSAHNIGYVYKPHPGEVNESYLQKEMFFGKLYRGSLDSSFKNYDYFLSFASTALLEATLSGKIAFQVFDKEFSDDRYEDFGYSYTVTMPNLELLPKMINARVPPLSHARWMVEGTIEERFLNALRAVEVL